MRRQTCCIEKQPRFNVAKLIEDGEYVVALGDIAVDSEDGTEEWHQYCDVWRFREGKMAELKAFVIKPVEGRIEGR